MSEVGINYTFDGIGNVVSNDKKIRQIMDGAGGDWVGSGSGEGECDVQYLMDQRLNDPEKLLARLRVPVPQIVHMNLCEYTEDDAGNMTSFNSIFTWMDLEYERTL